VRFAIAILFYTGTLSGAYEEGAKYKLAIVCSSSKEGDLFKGAGGSTLILDELEVMGE
ncbi:PCMD domain-containing protein, partial [Bacteroides sp. MSK.20.82]|uniref:PCMD domain-containing protein n=1 Tax=Bacteroides sp. MSK.20.82 TaxID=2849174 RepID=UPI001C2C138B